jgi:hypothetical protein
MNKWKGNDIELFEGNNKIEKARAKNGNNSI